MRVGRIQGLEGPFWASRLHMSSVFENGAMASAKWGVANLRIVSVAGEMSKVGGKRGSATVAPI